MIRHGGLASLWRILWEVAKEGENMKVELSLNEQMTGLAHKLAESGITYTEAVREFKRHYIQRVLKMCANNQCQAARVLEMHRNTLGRTLTDLNMDGSLKRHAALTRIPPRRQSLPDVRKEAAPRRA